MGAEDALKGERLIFGYSKIVHIASNKAALFSVVPVRALSAFGLRKMLITPTRMDRLGIVRWSVITHSSRCLLLFDRSPLLSVFTTAACCDTASIPSGRVRTDAFTLCISYDESLLKKLELLLGSMVS
jgi:hypothetical protein